jgi:protein-disulfide isomerase
MRQVFHHYAHKTVADLTSAPVPPLRDDDHVRGTGETVLFYGDFACPRCALAWQRLRTEELELVFRHFALKAKHPRAVALAAAAEAAGNQAAFFDFADRLYADRGRDGDPHLWGHAEALGLDVERFDADRKSPEVLQRVERDVKEALRAGATATPTLFVRGKPHPGPPSDSLVREWSGSDQRELDKEKRPPSPTRGRPEGKYI